MSVGLIHSFALRRLVALARGLVETKPEQAQAWPEFFDNSDGIGPVKRTLFYKHKSGVLLPWKGSPTPVPVANKVGIEAHITAIAFGTTSSARAFWRKQIGSGVLPPEVIDLYGLGFDREDPQFVAKVAERMALHQRFWKVPYHYVGLLNGDLLRNNAITRYTFHGDSGNAALVGVAAEADLPGLAKDRKKKHHELTRHFIETNRQTLRLAVTQSRAQGAPILSLYAHRQYDNGRIGDPGEEWWREVGIPVADELHLERRVRFKAGDGYEICHEWDPLGQVDYRGKKLAA